MAVYSNYRILSEKTLHHNADPSLMAYCPSMDLVALVTTDQQVLIYRLNGQRVYGATQKLDRLRVASIRWKPNGQLPLQFNSRITIADALQDSFLPLPGVMDPSD